jgi:hypothetical protein
MGADAFAFRYRGVAEPSRVGVEGVKEDTQLATAR